MHPGGGMKMHQTDAVRIKVSDGQLKDELRIALQQFLPVWWGPVQSKDSALTDGIFWQEIAIVLMFVAPGETQADPTSDVRLPWAKDE